MAKEEKDENEEKGGSGGSMKLIVIILVVLLLVVIGVGVALFMMMGKDDKAAESGDETTTEEVVEVKTPIYVPLHPAFLVNFEDQSSASHLQVDVQVMSYDDGAQAALKTHMPKIRNDLLLLFGSQKYEELNTIKGKRELSKKSIEVVEKALKEAGEPIKIEAFLFTSFVMQ